MVSKGGTKTVDAEPLLELALLRLSNDWMVIMDPVIEPVGERVSERSIIGR